MKLNFKFGEGWGELKKIENLPLDEKKIIFYAENKASMNHFKALIVELTEKMNFHICYVTSVKDDLMLTSKNQKIKSFYIGDGAARTKFFLTLRTKIMIMDMPDLERFHIKRSKVYSVHYIYIFHSMFSIHSYLREGAIDNYDTIFCVGEHHVNEIRETEKVYKLKPKKLLSYGFPRLDTLMQQQNHIQINSQPKKLVLITPSYGKDNLLETCGLELIDILLKSNFKVLVRPHFKILKESKKLMKKIDEEFGKNPDFILEEGIISAELFQSSTCMISDWSGISFEYAFTFERSVIFIDVPKKILNPNSGKISLEPIEISNRHKIGHVILPTRIKEIPNLIITLNEDEKNDERIRDIRSKTVYNLGKSAKIGAEYIQKLNKELSLND